MICTDWRFQHHGYEAFAEFPAIEETDPDNDMYTVLRSTGHAHWTLRWPDGFTLRVRTYREADPLSVLFRPWEHAA